MMNQQKSKKAGILKYSLIVPLALALILSSNAETIVNSTKNALSSTKNSVVDTKNPVVNIQEENKPQVEKTVQDTTSIKQKKEQQAEIKNTYTVVEKMPQYQGGEGELINYIGKNVKYPANAQAKRIQGKSIVRFIVTNMGKIENAEIVRSLDPECDKEAIRVINSMPQFIPGEQNGKKVSVYYTLPIVFRLDDAFSSSNQGENPNVGVEYGDKIFNNSGTAPKVKESDPNNPPVFVVGGKIQSKDFDVQTIKPGNIERVDVIKPDAKNKTKLVSEYGKDAVNGVVKITLKN